MQLNQGLCLRASLRTTCLAFQMMLLTASTGTEKAFYIHFLMLMNLS